MLNAKKRNAINTANADVMMACFLLDEDIFSVRLRKFLTLINWPLQTNSILDRQKDEGTPGLALGRRKTRHKDISK